LLDKEKKYYFEGSFFAMLLENITVLFFSNSGAKLLNGNSVCRWVDVASCRCR